MQIFGVTLTLWYIVFSSFACPSSYTIPPLPQTWLYFRTYRSTWTPFRFSINIFGWSRKPNWTSVSCVIQCLKYFIFKMWNASFNHGSEVVHEWMTHHYLTNKKRVSLNMRWEKLHSDCLMVWFVISAKLCKSVWWDHFHQLLWI